MYTIHYRHIHTYHTCTCTTHVPQANHTRTTYTHNTTHTYMATQYTTHINISHTYIYHIPTYIYTQTCITYMPHITSHTHNTYKHKTYIHITYIHTYHTQKCICTQPHATQTYMRANTYTHTVHIEMHIHTSTHTYLYAQIQHTHTHTTTHHTHTHTHTHHHMKCTALRLFSYAFHPELLVEISGKDNVKSPSSIFRKTKSFFFVLDLIASVRLSVCNPLGRAQYFLLETGFWKYHPHP